MRHIWVFSFSCFNRLPLFISLLASFLLCIRFAKFPCKGIRLIPMYPEQSSLADAAGKVGRSLSDFTNTFILSSAQSTEQVLCEVPKALVGDPVRQRRTHQKSRAGCESCKTRRVKVSSSMAYLRFRKLTRMVYSAMKKDHVQIVPGEESNVNASSEPILKPRFSQCQPKV